LLESQHTFGRFLDRAVEENTSVVIVTSATQDESRLPDFRKLEERGMNVFFVAGLHAKLYLFDVDMQSRNRWQQGIQSHAIVGSSNLTKVGLGLNDARANEELNCRIALTLLEEARTYVARLMKIGDDYRKFAFRLRSGRPQ